MTLAVYIAPWEAAAAVCVVCLLAGVRDDIANAAALMCGLREWWMSHRPRRMSSSERSA